MNVESKRTLIAEVEKLLDLELFDSVETLCSLYVSHLVSVEFKAPASESVSLILSEIYELLGDALFKRNELKRALHYYRTANHRRKSAHPAKFRAQTVVASAEEAKLKYKECKCLVELRDLSTAVKDLESIPAKLRTVQVHLLLGNLYKRTNRRRNAVLAYKEALALTPYAIGVIEHLVELGVEASEILSVLDDAFRYRDSASLISDGWLHSLVAALVHKRNHEHEKSFGHLQRLSATYPKNTYLLGHQTHLAIEMDMIDQALTLYKQVRRQDAHLVRGTEVFGRLLFLREETAELSKLTDEVLDASPQAPVGWLLAAMFSAVKGEPDSALAFLDKAVRVEPTYAEAYRLRGHLLFAQESVDQALIAFNQACSIDKDMASFAGQVKCHLTLGKAKEAAACAREALTLYPRSCEAHIVMGSVFAAGSAESMGAYAKALQLNPLSKTAAMSLAEVLVAQGKADEAAACLQSILNKVSCHKLRLALGKVFAALGRYKESVENLHLSISQNPVRDRERDAALGNESEAQQELERVEGLMRGENADEEDEEECDVEVEGDDVEVEEEDGELADYHGDFGGEYSYGAAGSQDDSAEGLRHLHELRTTRDIQNDMRGLDGSSSSMEHDGDHSGQLGSLNHSLMDAFNQHSGDLSPTGRRGMFADSVGSAGSGGRGLFQPSGGRGDSASRSRSMFQEDSDVQDDALLYGSLNNSDEAPFTP